MKRVLAPLLVVVSLHANSAEAEKLRALINEPTTPAPAKEKELPAKESRQIIHGDTADKTAPHMGDKDKCEVFFQYLDELSYQKGYETGKQNAKHEIESRFNKMGEAFDNLFRIKDFYIEGILEPPLIVEDREDEISSDGKALVKKEVRYSVVKPSSFKKPLNWRDFLLDESKPSDPVYEVEYRYYHKGEACKKTPKRVGQALDSGFTRGYNDAISEVVLLYKQRLKKLRGYLDGLYHYQRLYLTKKIEPPLISTLLSDVYSDKANMTISEENYYIVEEAKFNPNYKQWENFLIIPNKERIMTTNRKVDRER